MTEHKTYVRRGRPAGDPMERKQPFSICLEPTLIERVDRQAMAQGMSASALVRAAVRQYLGE